METQPQRGNSPALFLDLYLMPLHGKSFFHNSWENSKVCACLQLEPQLLRVVEASKNCSLAL